jgi:enterochelin esterase-like enzyme
VLEKHEESIIEAVEEFEQQAQDAETMTSQPEESEGCDGFVQEAVERLREDEGSATAICEPEEEGPDVSRDTGRHGIGEPRTGPDHPRLILHPDFKSELLPDCRDIIVYLPLGYHESEQSYPVLYLHDGQNLFDGSTSYVPGRVWGVHETADALIAAGKIEPVIIVGVHNTGLARLDEYTPTASTRMGGGKADLYGRMLVEEVKPMIDSTFRTRTGSENTGLGGSSLGGLVTLYLGLQRPDIFGKLAVLSPSVWWDHKIILSFVREASPKPPLKIWLDMGTSEGPRTLRDSDLLYKLLVAQGWVEGDDLLYIRVEGGTHDEAAWAQRVAPFLEFLFPA